MTGANGAEVPGANKTQVPGANGGRRPGTVAVGVDVGGTRLRVVAQDCRGQRSDVREIAVPRTAEGVVAGIAKLTRELTDGAGVDQVAVGLPGHTTDTEVRWVPNLRFLDGVPLAAHIADGVGAACRLLNDAEATLLAELREGAAAGRRHALLVAVGTGIGGAILLDGRLYHGAHGCAGSFGWLPADGAAADEDHGAWERAAAGPALDTLGRPWGGAEAVARAARDGDADALAFIDAYGARLGVGTAALASVFDPEVIVLAGGLSAILDLIREPLLSAHAAAASPEGRRVPVVRAALGPRAGVIGALHAALTPEVLA